MKKLFLLTFLVLFFVSCNMNPSKEARIQLLETEMVQTSKKMDSLTKRIHALESINKELKSNLLEQED